MVKGIEIFRKYFEQYSANYVIIGGTACEIIISEAGFTPRATKDIDIILVVEALTPDFVEQFWQFIIDGNYEKKEKSDDQRKYYRFMKPENQEFPFQIELFARNPDLISLDEEAHLTPIPVDDDLSSLSAILLNDDYYNYMIEHSTLKDGLHHANTEALICLKAKAYLEIEERIANGSTENSKQLRKHKADIFRLAVMLAADDRFELPETIQQHLTAFAKANTGDLPDKNIFKEMGLGKTEPVNVFNQLLANFNVSL
ncbi:MAG: hypothetical protein ABI091_12425 [Ferruginibacter sp.]